MLIEHDIKDVLFFNSTRTCTLAILDSLKNIKHWVQVEGGYNEEVVPIKFGNYEKSIELMDMDPEVLKESNFNFIPRMVLSFEGMTKDAPRVTNKFNKISKRVQNDFGDVRIEYAFNSVPYNLQYRLVLQARGLNEAFQIVEQMLPLFRPTYPISIQEYPLFEDKTETLLSISDPEFEIMDEFSQEDVNIVNVTFELGLKTNLYMPLKLAGPVETIRMMTHLWESQEYKESQLASHFEFDVCKFDGKIYNDSIHRAYAPERAVVKEIVPEVQECEPSGTTVNTGDFTDILTEEGYNLITEESRD